MTATTPTSTAVAVVEPVFSSAEQLALAGFLAGYTGLTREAYALDLRQCATWCHQRHIRLFEARRADIECFARDLEAKGRARATVTRRLCTIAGFYRYALEEDLLHRSPAAHVRRPRLDYESHATGLDRNELQLNPKATRHHARSRILHASMYPSCRSGRQLARSGGTRGRRMQGRCVAGGVLVCRCGQPGGRRAWGAGDGR